MCVCMHVLQTAGGCGTVCCQHCSCAGKMATPCCIHSIMYVVNLVFASEQFDKDILTMTCSCWIKGACHTSSSHMHVGFPVGTAWPGVGGTTVDNLKQFQCDKGRCISSSLAQWVGAAVQELPRLCKTPCLSNSVINAVSCIYAVSTSPAAASRYPNPMFHPCRS